MGSKKMTKKKSAARQETKKRPKKTIVIVSVALAVLVAAGVAFGIFMYQSTKDLRSLEDSVWVPKSADNASGDEVPMDEVYQTKYSNYRGSLKFKSDGTFDLWMSPGEPSDGTHTGKYELADDDTVSALFDDGTQCSFLLHREAGAIDGISIAYSDYIVYFVRESSD